MKWTWIVCAEVVMRAMILATLGPAMAGFAAPALGADGDSLFCGELVAHERSSATQTGSITVGGKTITLAAEPLYSSHPGTQERLKVGSAICFSASWNAAGEAYQYLVNAMPSELCGRVHDASSTAVRLQDLGTGTFPLAPGAELGPTIYPPRTCFTIALGPDGNARITGRVLTVVDRTVSRTNICGLVSRWSEPTREAAGSLRHSSEGEIVVGSHRYVIVARTSYSLVNVPPVVGKPTCLSASLDGSGGIIQYAAQPWMPDAFTASPPVEYIAPSASRDGLVRFVIGDRPQTPESYRYRIPAGTAMPSDAASGRYAWVIAIDQSGDAIVTGTRLPDPPQLGGAATVMSARSQAAPAAPRDPLPDRSATQSESSPPDLLTPAVALGVIALALGYIGFVRPRRSRSR